MRPTKNQAKEKLADNGLRSEKPADPRNLPLINDARRVIRKEKKRYQSALEEQREFNCHLTEAGILSHVNEAYCRYFGKKAEELIGQNYFTLIPKNDQAEIRRRFAVLTPENPVTIYDQKIKTSSGEIRWQQYSNRAVFDKSGKIVEFLVVGRDITERKRSEESLRESEKRYRAIVEDQIELVCRYRPDGTLTFVNQSYCRLYGKTREELIDKSFLPFISDIDRFWE